MIRQAATALIRRGNILSRRTQISTSHNNYFSGVGGVHLRLLTSSSTKNPSTSTSSSIRSNPTATVSQTKDARDAALEKSQRLHAELKEVRFFNIMCHSP